MLRMEEMKTWIEKVQILKETEVMKMATSKNKNMSKRNSQLDHMCLLLEQMSRFAIL